MTRLPRPHWRRLIQALALTAAAACAVAVWDLLQNGIHRPGLTVLGLLATVAINRVYVVTRRAGSVRETVDLAEIPIVALALLLPPSQALLAFALGSLAVELPQDRAPIKKMFNVGMRVVAATAVVVPMSLLGPDLDVSPLRVVVVVWGAVLYWTVDAVLSAVLISAIQGTSPMHPLRAPLLPERVLIWSCSVAVGVTAGAAALTMPALLLGLAALLVLLANTSADRERARADSERLQGVLEATAAIQSAAGPAAQDAALVQAARDLLPWRYVEITHELPPPGSVARSLPSVDDVPRWLVVTPRPHADPWSEDDERVLDTLAGSAGVTIELSHLQAQMAEQAMIDPLTGLANRRRLDVELRRLCRTGTAFSLLVLDLDGFKAINDQLGHETGDSVLEHIALRLRTSQRDGDVVARLGGDEFVILLPGAADQDSAAAVADKVADAVAQPLQVGSWGLRVRTSIGLAVAPFDGGTPQALLRAADQRMYEAKRASKEHGGDRDLIAVKQPVGQRRGDVPGPR